MEQQLRISAGKSLALFICWWVLCTLLGSVIIGLVGADDVQVTLGHRVAGPVHIHYAGCHDCIDSRTQSVALYGR